MREEFKDWLISQGKTRNVANNYASMAATVGRDYAEKTGATFIDVYGIDDAAVVSEISRQYSRGGDYEEDGDTNNGGWRAAINRYAEFVADRLVDGGEPEPNMPNEPNVDSANFGLERDLQRVFCSQISALFPGYKILRREYPIRKRRIDVLLQHENSEELLVVELKAGRVGESVFGQISAYVGMLRHTPEFRGKKVRGAIVAGEINDGLRYACETNPDISVKTYRMSIELEDSDSPDVENESE